MRTFARRALVLALPLLLAGCLGSDGGGSSMMTDAGNAPSQPFPDNFRAEALAYMRTYLNNPVGVRNAGIAEPVLRTVGGRPFYVACLRFAPRESDGGYRDPRERGILYVNGRLDRILEPGAETCVGAVYAPFPELEKMSR